MQSQIYYIKINNNNIIINKIKKFSYNMEAINIDK